MADTNEIIGILDDSTADMTGTLDGDLIRGYSAYEIYLEQGGTLSKEEWLESLKGADGHTPELSSERTGSKETTLYADGVAFARILDGIDGADGQKGDKGDTGETGPEGPQGPKGDTGADGHTPVKGTDYWTQADQTAIVNDVLESQAISDIQDDLSDVKSDLTQLDNDKYEKPASGIPASDLASGVIPDVSGKADKVQSATSGNFASLDANGNLTDSGHKHSDYLTEAPVTDVQIDGTSVLNQGVANIPIGSASQLGLVKHNTAYGVYITPAGYLCTIYARGNGIKGGTDTASPITPFVQHESTFYGLAKAAGDTTQASSSNAVGTYTEEAKQAIRQMLGSADGSDYRLIYSTNATDSSDIDVTTDSNGDSIALKAVFVLAICPVGQAASSGISVAAYDGDTQKGVGYINTNQNTTEKKRGYCIIDASHGLWKTEMVSFGTSGLMSVQTYVRFTDVLGGHITKVKLSGVIAGYSISVYGY